MENYGTKTSAFSFYWVYSLILLSLYYYCCCLLLSLISYYLSVSSCCQSFAISFAYLYLYLLSSSSSVSVSHFTFVTMFFNLTPMLIIQSHILQSTESARNMVQSNLILLHLFKSHPSSIILTVILLLSFSNVTVVYVSSFSNYSMF
jgi:hypothetical protein